jgi:8-oxo-dGTP diphosphatase
MLTTDCVLFSAIEGDLNILLIQRDKSPFEGSWALPGGFMEIDETLENAAYRELKEETGITSIKLKQLGIFDKPGRDPRGRVISVAFYALLDKHVLPKAASDARQARWFSFNNLPPLAFDHAEIIALAVQQIVAKKTD